ncbi:MAG: Zn-ribbon domain-containing OB-fold protein, partial [Nitrososphaerales archaeon]
MISREQFIEKVKNGKVLANKCKRCGNTQLATVVFCGKCYSQDFEEVEVEGKGKVVTYTIQNVAPQEYEKYGPYAWVVVRLDAGFNISGFLPNIDSPKNLPINARIKIVGYDERG